MSSISSYSPNNSSQISSSQNGQSVSGSDNLLNQLSDRVRDTLSQKENPVGDGGQAAVQKISPQDVVNYMSQIANQTMPGASLNALV